MNKVEKYQNNFFQFRGKLMSFIYRIVNNRQEAEDIVQSTYIKVFKNLNSFQQKSSFKTWVFSIATNLAKDGLRANKRWRENWQDLAKEYNLENKQCEAQTIKSELMEFEIREHINFCFNCITKTLPLLSQVCLLLKEVYSFKVSEIIFITNVSEGKVKHALADARKDMNLIFEKRCSLINKEGICHQCTELNGIFNPEQDSHIESNKISMVKEANLANYDELLNLRLQLVKSIDPLNAKGANLHNSMMENCPKLAQIQMSKTE